MNNITDFEQPSTFTAFDSTALIAAGSLTEVAEKVKEYIDNHSMSSILIFDDRSSKVIDIDFRGTVDDVLNRLSRAEIQGKATEQLISTLQKEQISPGRPKLGVVAREVTLLPRHWDWLNRQPGGSSVALRKLVEEARRVSGGKDRQREAQENAYRFMSAVAGDLPGFEEALRALFAGSADRFSATIAEWPTGLHGHILKIASAAFESE